jgi:high-affinity iron transporter
VGARRQFRWVTLGGALGFAMSLGMGLAVAYLSGPLVDLGPDVIGAGVIFLAVGLLTWHAWWMQSHARAIRGEVEQRIDRACATQRLWIVGLIAFTGVFREGAETVLFLWGLMAESAGAAGRAGIVGGVAGVATAAALGWLVFRGGRHVSLSRFFLATTALILLLAAGLFSTGVGRLEGMGVLPMSRTVWDTSALLSDRSTVGSFLGGLVGYRARPSLLEALAYAAYVAAAGALIFAPRRQAAGLGAPAMATVPATRPGPGARR